MHTRPSAAVLDQAVYDYDVDGVDALARSRIREYTSMYVYNTAWRTRAETGDGPRGRRARRPTGRKSAPRAATGRGATRKMSGAEWRGAATNRVNSRKM